MTNLSIRIHMFITSLVSELKNDIKDERGQDLLEYVLLGGLIALAIIGIGVMFRGALVIMAGNIGNCLDFAAGTPCTPGF